MPTFGFSAFLKVLSLNVRPQRTELKKRLLPSVEGGYDFHRRFRLLAHRYLSEGEGLPELCAETDGYGNVAEGRAAREALEFLERWRVNMPGQLFAFGPRIWESASGTFKVKFTPDFGIEIDGVRVAVHIWKTQKPPLDIRMTYAALSLFTDLYADEVGGPQDFAVLSVIDGRLYRLSDVDNPSAMAERVMIAIENLLEDIGDEITSPQPPTGDQPGSPPTAPS